MQTYTAWHLYLSWNSNLHIMASFVKPAHPSCIAIATMSACFMDTLWRFHWLSSASLKEI